MADYLRHTEALRFIDECQERGIRILGIEFFVLTDRRVTPVGIADWSGASAEESWRESRELLRDGVPDGGNAVEFVTDE